jgi:hypothetical protein
MRSQVNELVASLYAGQELLACLASDVNLPLPEILVDSAASCLVAEEPQEQPDITSQGSADAGSSQFFAYILSCVWFCCLLLGCLGGFTCLF